MLVFEDLHIFLLAKRIILSLRYGILLNYKKGVVIMITLKTLNGIIYKTYKEACYVMRLLVDDKEFTYAIIEVSNLASGIQLRRLFVTRFLMNIMSKPDEVWNKTWKLLSDDIVYQ